MKLQIVAHLLSLLILLIIALVGALGMAAGMSHDQQAPMPNCAVMNRASAVCRIGSVAHVVEWQQLFLATLQSGTSFLLGVLVGFAIVLLLRSHPLSALLAQAYKRYQHQHPNARVYDYLLLARSQGIIQPRLYA